jgi:hypothetical protein
LEDFNATLPNDAFFRMYSHYYTGLYTIKKKRTLKEYQNPKASK